MGTVGIRELKEQASRIIRRVEAGEEVKVTNRGRVVARIVREDRADSDAEVTAAVLSDLDRLAAEFGARWPRGVTAVDAVRDVRRDL